MEDAEGRLDVFLKDNSIAVLVGMTQTTLHNLICLYNLQGQI
jgi:hypothetical protein